MTSKSCWIIEFTHVSTLLTRTKYTYCNPLLTSTHDTQTCAQCAVNSLCFMESSSGETNSKTNKSKVGCIRTAVK